MGKDPTTYYVGSIFESWGREITGEDLYGRAIDLDLLHKEARDPLQNEFAKISKFLEETIQKLFDELYPHFKDRFRTKLSASGNSVESAEYLIRRAELYNEKTG